jgi:pyruvate kinase
MVWGTKAFYHPEAKESTEGIAGIMDQLKERGYVDVGDRVVYVTGANPYEAEGTNIIKVETVK